MRISQLRPTAGKYHVEVPFSEPLVLRDGGTDKQEWSAMLGWVLGCLSEAAFPGDAARFFDPLTDRLLQPVHLTTRRNLEEPEPITALQDGASVDWWRLLIALEFPSGAPIVEQTREEPRAIPACLSVAEDAIVQGLLPAISAVGIGQGRWRLYLALAGALRNRGATEEGALRICEEISRRAGVDDKVRTANRKRCVWHTFNKPDHYIGFTTLRAEFFEVAEAFRDVFDSPEDTLMRRASRSIAADADKE